MSTPSSQDETRSLLGSSEDTSSSACDPTLTRARALGLASDLAKILRGGPSPPPKPEFKTRIAILQWIEFKPTPVALFEAEEQVDQLKKAKERLQLHNQLLSEQIAAQAEKIDDLERSLAAMRTQLDEANDKIREEREKRLEGEMEKYKIKSDLSEEKFRAVERSVMEQHKRRLSTSPSARPSPPKTPPANYGRLIERNAPVYSSLPRAHAQPSTSAEARQQLAEQMEESPQESISPSLRIFRERVASAGRSIDEDDTSRMSVIYTEPRIVPMLWQLADVREWDCEATCSWLVHLNLDMYVPAARAWLGPIVGGRGVIATALPTTIDNELNIKHPMHKKKILLALSELLGDHGDPLLPAAGRLDTTWVLRWLEDVGVNEIKTSAIAASLDGRLLHRLTHTELHTHLKVAHAMYSLSIQRGIQVLRENNFHPETMIRRGPEKAPAVSAGDISYLTLADMMTVEPVPKAQLCRWSSHRVMQWLNQIDLAEYAPNLPASGVHGGLMVLEPRFNSDLLSDLLMIPSEKTLLRRYVAQKFHAILGRDELQIKRKAEKSRKYHPLTPTTKYKGSAKSPFSLRRKKSREGNSETDLVDLVCPFGEDTEGEQQTTSHDTAPCGKTPSARDVTPGH